MAPPSLRCFQSPGRYVQGRDATHYLGEELRRCGIESPVLLLADPVVIPTLSDAWAKTFSATGYEYKVVTFGGECTTAETDRVVAEARQLGAHAMVNCGGGKVLDTGRGAAVILGIPVVNCPSAASTDAPATALSVVYKENGEFSHYTFFKSNPRLIVMDSTVIARAPKRLLVAGMGDALGTWFEARSCYEANAHNLLEGNYGVTRSALALAKLCYETLLEFGEDACIAVDSKVVTPALEHIIEANTLLSGLGAESGGLMVAHSVNNGLSAAPGAHHCLHGEKVAFGTCTQLVLEGRPKAELEEVYGFCCKVGLPVTLAQLGVDAADEATVMAVAERSCAEGETLHGEPFEVTPQKLRDAMLAADLLGRKHLAKAAAAAPAVF